MWVEVGHKLWYYFNPQLFMEMIRVLTQEDIDNWFQYHTPTPEQIPKYGAIREAGKHMAQVIMENSPASADQTAAIRKVREAVMTANAALACDGH